MKIKTSWSGYYPNLCSGEWTISIDDKELNLSLENEGYKKF